MRRLLAVAVVALSGGCAHHSLQDGKSAGPTSAAAAAPSNPPAKNVPTWVLATAQISGELPRLDDRFKIDHRGQTVVGIYKFCVAPSGDMVSVAPIQGPRSVIPTLMTWKFKPQPQQLCAMTRFVWTLN